MSLRKHFLTSALALTLLSVAPATASADWLFTPFIGGTFGGSAKSSFDGDDFEDDLERKLTYGASIGYMGAGVIGFEIDFGYSPNFFGGGDGDFDVVSDSNVTTLMGNLLIGAPLGPVRPYASGGVGLIKSSINVEDFFDVDNSNFGFNLGAGLMGFFSDNVGIRGDVRFFRALNSDTSDGLDVSLNSFKFFRGTVGITFRF